MRRTLISIAVASQLVFASPVLATDSGSIPAEVTMDAPCITIDSGTLDYGTMRFGGVVHRTKGFTLCHGSGLAFIYGSATDATTSTPGGSGSWALVTTPPACPGPTPDLNKFDIFAAVTPNADPPSSGTLLSTSPAFLWSADPGTLTLWADLETPCEGSSGAGETMTFTIQLTTTFS